MAYPSAYGSDYRREQFGRRAPEPAYEPHGISKKLFACTLFAALLFALWAGAASSYLFFRDEALGGLVSRQITTSRAYDAQIATLNTEIERLRSVKLIDQERVERQVADLSRTQRMIDARHKALSALAQSWLGDVTATVPPTPAATKNTPAPPVPMPTEENGKPKPLTNNLEDMPLRSSLDGQTPSAAPAVVAVSNPNTQLETEIAAIQRTLQATGNAQHEVLHALTLEFDARNARTRKALSELGPAFAKTHALKAQTVPAGGPFIAANLPKDPFMRQVFQLRQAALEHRTLVKQFDAVPVQLPVLGDAEITSGFGNRLDPFLKQLAFHSGVDLRGEEGDPVRAAAKGIVTFAGYHNAYGLMVEIDHGNGLSTRYAHLSALSVKEGAAIAAGALLGKIGTTGRSTAPHLHYEIRLNGDAIDPRRYLRAARLLQPAR